MNSVTIHTNQTWLAIFRPFGGGMGLTLGHHIWFYGEAEKCLLAHELVHIKQYEEMGILKFLLVYLCGVIKLGKKPISDHPLEAPAYKAQYECKE